jgi:hypothetical protein
MSKTGFPIKPVAFGQISPKLTFMKKTLFIHGPMKLDELIPNINLFFLQRVHGRLKTDFRPDILGFWEHSKIA